MKSLAKIFLTACTILTAETPYAYGANTPKNASEQLESSADQKNQDAAATYLQALAKSPTDFTIAFNLASEYYKRGQFDNAITYYTKTLELNPSCMQAAFNCGISLATQERYDEAIKQFQLAVNLHPSYYKAFLHMGNAYEKKGNLQQAIDSYQKAIAIKSDYIDALMALGRALCASNKFDESIARYKIALTFDPSNKQLLLELANTLNMHNELDRALKTYEAILKLSPDNSSVLYNIAYTLKKLGRLDEAFPMYQKVLELDPNHSEAHFSLGLAYLVTGNFEKGWQEYEWRWKRPNHPTERNLGKPLWDGSDLTGKTILLHAEQGLGDTFQFIRCAQIAKERGAAKVVAAVQKPLIDILSLCDYLDVVAGLQDPVPVFDVHAPLMSLPYILKITEQTIPITIPYLKAKPELISYWKDKLASDTNVKVGICWQGNTGYSTHFLRTAVAAKSISLASFAPLFAIPGVSIYNLQKITGEDQLEKISDSIKLRIFEAEDFDTTHGRFMDTAAVMKNLDLVITIDTSIAHLAGGLGIPVWVFIPEPPDWRWLLKRIDTPWYPTMRLFRQPTIGDWETPMKTVAHELAALVQQKYGQQPTAQQPQSLQPMHVNLSADELLDRITMLQAKLAQPLGTTIANKLHDELTKLQDIAQLNLQSSPALEMLIANLLEVNKKLLALETTRQENTNAQVFDQLFIDLAREAYFKNNERSRIKRAINTLVTSNHLYTPEHAKE